MVTRKSLLFKTSGRGATFRLVGNSPPREEVSYWSQGMFQGAKIRELTTAVLTRKGPVDVLKGVGMISGGESSTAYYRIDGVAVGQGDWEKEFGEGVTGTMAFGANCTGRLRVLRSVKAPLEAIVGPDRNYQTRVWKIAR